MNVFLFQAGRAGRRQGASLAVILGRERSLDVFYMKNPQKARVLALLPVTERVALHFCIGIIEMGITNGILELLFCNSKQFMLTPA